MIYEATISDKSLTYYLPASSILGLIQNNLEFEGINDIRTEPKNGNIEKMVSIVLEKIKPLIKDELQA